MRLRFVFIAALLPSLAAAALVPDVRAAIARQDFAGAEKRVRDFHASAGATPEMILGLSWLGRGHLAAGNLTEAERFAAETRELALAELKKRPLDAEKDLPLALGASIEVQAHVLDKRGERDQGVAFLRSELKTWFNTSIRTRIQKNLHLLSLEGKPAPPLEVQSHLGPKPTQVSAYRGQTLLLFFWAHWCGDCKQQGPVLARLQREYGPRGLAILGPTQRYGYVAGGQDATPAEETPYIDRVRRQFYGALDTMPVPLGEETFKNYGVSTTPTLVLVDSTGIVRLYHPGKMTYEDLRARIESVLGAS
ncbi:MAG: TlpA family protein disulfide reductase [Bryobacterales bacterium]|nr:TlpA family protein disulfide reductase [Bryobacterales bacterium]